MAAPENPWRTLRARPHLKLVWKPLPEEMGAMWAGNTILIDPGLDRIERRCALMHELVHEDRRIGWPFATEATMEHEEAQVRRETAIRLVPLDLLAQLTRELDGIEPITAPLVAREFDVTTTVAMTAIRVLQDQLLRREWRDRARDVGAA